jgi:GGDEF domain-containing protein
VQFFFVSLSWLFGDEKHTPVSISVGVGEYDGQTSPEDITSRSDEALYSAKQAGKNTVRIFQSSRQR